MLGWRASPGAVLPYREGLTAIDTTTVRYSVASTRSQMSSCACVPTSGDQLSSVSALIVNSAVTDSSMVSGIWNLPQKVVTVFDGWSTPISSDDRSHDTSIGSSDVGLPSASKMVMTTLGW